MTDFVLVPGAWLGAWAWDEVVPVLREAGCGAHALTLAGLAERAKEEVGPGAHVHDIVDAIERRDLRDVVLVGHSYAGIPVGQAAGRIGDRLAHVVYVDAVVPAEGASFASVWWQGRPAFEQALAGAGGRWMPQAAPDYAGQDLTDARIEQIVSGSTPHPGASLTDPAGLLRPVGELPSTYVSCLLDAPEPGPDVAALLTAGTWRHVTMDTGHWPMFSRPAELAAVLLDAAGRPGS
ncbi:alpha/beta fold hydrolase [Streptomyces sp. NPDC047999]|uniref:alpha/beta fold hydrolase n=1 Tax=Streptomyces sp. NPDC047999 TaxID=3365497 RepID=UPI00371611C8